MNSDIENILIGENDYGNYIQEKKKPKLKVKLQQSISEEDFKVPKEKKESQPV